MYFLQRDFDNQYAKKPDSERIREQLKQKSTKKLKPKHEEIFEYLLERKGQSISVWALLERFFKNDIDLEDKQRPIHSRINIQTAVSAINRYLEGTAWVVVPFKEGKTVVGYGLYERSDIEN